MTSLPLPTELFTLELCLFVVILWTTIIQQKRIFKRANLYFYACKNTNSSLSKFSLWNTTCDMHRIKTYFLSGRLCLAAEAQKGNIQRYHHSSTNIQWKLKPFFGTSILENTTRSCNNSAYNTFKCNPSHPFCSKQTSWQKLRQQIWILLGLLCKHLPFVLNFGILFWLLLTAVWSVGLDVSFCIKIKFARFCFFLVLGTWTFIQ